METPPPPAETVPALCVERDELGGPERACEGFPPLPETPVEAPVQIPAALPVTGDGTAYDGEP